MDEKKVSYKIYDVDLPVHFSINERGTNESIEKKTTTKKISKDERHEILEQRKIDAKKEHPTAYEPWNASDDEFLKNYWNDQSNKQNSYEKIDELIEKLDRSKGAIKARLKKLGLD